MSSTGSSTPSESSRYRLVESVYQAALDQSPDRRAAYLSSACSSDPQLQEEVQLLLAHFERAGDDYLATPVYATPRGSLWSSNLPTRIGRYEIVREIGRGGAGVVYEARQDHPQRSVALKVMRYTAPGPDLLRRFQLEAEALGQLNHPGIAHVYEAGIDEQATPTGDPQRIPFVAMELVVGSPLCEFAATHSLTLLERLELLAQICDAVHHAHQKGVIHRDLKPANILVADSGTEARRHEGTKAEAPLRDTSLRASVPSCLRASPKIVDFGVARIAGSALIDTVAHTRSGQLIGTLAYMSPEQLAGDARAVDTRSDVYSLGVVAYELLTGRLPIDVAKLPLPIAIRTLAEKDAPRGGALRRELRGEAEAILAKAMERSPDRRYASAAEFAADVRRLLRGEPVIARPATAWYTFQKAVRRHRVEATLAGSLFVLAVASAITLAVFHWRASRGWQAAELERTAAAAARDAEHDARVFAESVNGFLHEMLAAAQPDAQGKDASLTQVLRSATQRLDAGNLNDQPIAAAAVLTTIGTTWQSLGDLAEAEAHFARALDIRRKTQGARHADIATTLNHVGEVRYLLDDRDGAERFFRESLAMRLALFGDMHASVAECYNNLSFIDRERQDFDAAEANLNHALRIWRATLGEDDANVDLCLHNLATLMADRGRHAAAVPFLREVLALRLKRHGREDHTLVISTRNNLARCLDLAGQYLEAEPIHRQNLALNRARLPAGHATIRSTVANLAECLRSQRRFAEAETLVRAEIGDATLADAAESSSLAHLYAALGILLTDRHDTAEAEPLLRWLVDYHIEMHGEDDATVAAVMNNLGAALFDKGDSGGAVATIERALTVNERVYGTPLNLSNATYSHHLAGICRARGECDRAEALLRHALAVRRAQLGDEHPLTISSQRALEGLLSGVR